MRRARWLILVLIVIIVSGLALVFKIQKGAQDRSAPPPPSKLPESVSARANDWMWEQTRGGKPGVRVWARDMKQNAEGNRIELDHVELHLFHKDGQSYDRVRSAKADLDVPNGQLFSDGEVEITMAVPTGEAVASQGRLVVIKTSGVHFDSKTGKASTDRPAQFRFDRGDGKALGAQYDPETRELLMHKDVKLNWRGTNPKTRPMEIEAGGLIYKETESKVFLTQWSKFRRDTLAMEGGNAVVFLNDGVIQKVEAATAKGVDTRPGRTIEYAADQLDITFDGDGVLGNVIGSGNARLLSLGPTAKTNVTSGRLELEFTPDAGDSVLRKATATTDAVVKSDPVPRPGILPADTRILRSAALVLYMRNGGREMERAETLAPGVAEFIPNRASQKHRIVNGDRMNVEYGPENQVRTFTATQVTTRTDNDPVKGKPQPPSLTQSKGMAAHFDPKTGVLATLEQWDDFRYQEGDRQAKADRAELQQSVEEMKLTGAARFWDPSGSTDADLITLRQKTGDFEAVGNVSSTRQPDGKKGAKDAGMLSGDDPVQARGAKMISSNDNTLITYSGDALMWQASNRITADTIKIDRKSNRLEATGNVNSQLLDNSATKTKAAGGAPKPAAKKSAPVFTIVRSPLLIYDDKARLADYKGGATLVRAGMTVTAAEIRAWLKQGDDSSLDHSFADGNVKIVQVSPERTRTGTSEHSEYYAEDGKLILVGGQPVVVDSVKGVTRGRQITYFSNDERLLVEGEEKKPAESRILRKKQP